MRILNTPTLAKHRLQMGDKKALTDLIEKALDEHHILRADLGHSYPSSYQKYTKNPSLFNVVKQDLERQGFKFKPVDLYSPSTRAVESVGNFHSLSYIIDLVFHHDVLKVDVYY